MFERILQLLKLSCSHNNLSKPFAASVAPSTSGDWESVRPTEGGSYVVCLDCGKRFKYDWNKMRVVS